ncbi:PAS domain-containing sensor histidine kinase [Meiothermus granaticius]|uniref:PAS domain-containing sensor histidine kinase n=1 Tax=Meiothermus granaticius TaxID=863370 RepID=UPI000E64E76D|nr:PAS domain-containing sensor histidine kinase [Meiothermus granaticius]MCL6526496.1 PAS domain-containing sensor histidine kinase [Thermaceae bacterium]GEM86737.1 hypothetical protein MGR01S_13620 [Meiothermus granaticius NBRC 107808]
MNVALRLRLALIYGLLASLALVLALLVGYGFYERAAYRNLDELLQLFVRQNAAHLASGIPLEPPRIGSPVALRLFSPEGERLDAVGDPQAPSIPPLPALSKGVPAYAHWIHWLPPINPVFSDSSQSAEIGFGLTVAEGSRWRSYTQRLPDGRLLQVVVSLYPTDRALGVAWRNFLGLAALGTLLVMLLGSLLTGPSLRPLTRLAARAREIARVTRHRPGNQGLSQDELGLLASTLQATIGHLEEEQDRLELALGAARMGWWEWDAQHDRHRWSPEFERLLGLEPGTFRGGIEAFLECVHPEDRARVEALIRGSGTADRPPTFEYRVALPGGGVRWIESRAQVYRGQNGAVLRLLGLDLDITERKQNEQELRESEARFRQLAETIPQLAWMADEHGSVFWYNQRWYEYTGTTFEEVAGWGWQRVHHPEVLPQVLERWKASLENGEPFDMTFPLRGADGVFRPFLTRIAPFKDANGRLRRWFGTNTDVTAQLEAEARQAYLVQLSDAVRPLTDPAAIQIEAARQLGQHLQVDRVVYFEVRGEEYIVGHDWSKGGGSLAGRYPVASFGQWLLDEYRSGRTAVLADVTAEAQRSPEEQQTYAAAEIRAYIGVPLVKGGRLVAGLAVHSAQPRNWSQSEITLVEETAERTWAALERAQAETALRQSEQRYRELSEGQKRFVADAAHELRAPLTAIQGNLDLLERFKDMSVEDREEAIAEAAREAGRLARLVNDLLALARGDAGARVRQELLQLEEVLREVFSSAQGLARGHTLELGSLERAHVQGDPDRLKELFLILLDNALKYTPLPGHVRLSCALQKGAAEVRVEDNGIGIAPHDLPRVFERFYRADHARTPGRDPGGTGLGLSIARWIVEQHSGSIWLESALGQGTTAVVRLPLAASSPQA